MRLMARLPQAKSKAMNSSNKRVLYMRLIVFFDLPVETAVQRKEYRLFRRYLIKNGYLMMQESVYSKLAINQRIAEGLIEKLKRHRPPNGLVQVLTVTERQYSSIANIAGDGMGKEALDTCENLVVL